MAQARGRDDRRLTQLLLEALTQTVDEHGGAEHDAGLNRVPSRLADDAPRLTQLDPEGAATYQKRLADFNARVDAKEKSWTPLVRKMNGEKIVTYHKSWSYVSKWLGMEEIGYLEIKPGIPPSPDHLLRLIQQMRAEHVQLLLVEDFYNLSTARLVADKAGAKMLVLPTDVGAKPEIRTWFDLAETVLRALANAAGAG